MVIIMEKQKDVKYRFPIKISENGRYFVDSNNNPFLWHGDTCWKLLWEFTLDEAREYLTDRAKRGFTVIQLHMLPHRVYQANRNGDMPFSEAGTITKINEAYFNHADTVIKMAGKLGLAVIIAPMWLSGWEQDWHKFFDVESAEIYSEFVAERYKSYDNIIGWIQGGDDDVFELRDSVRAAVAVYKKIDPLKLNTFHAWAKGGWSIFPGENWWDFNMAYTYSYPFLLSQLKEAREFEPHKPVVLGETHYDGNDDVTSETIRRYAYTAMLLGSAGHTYGNKDIWTYTMFWREGMCTAATHHMRNLKNFMDSLPWWKMKPAEFDDIFRKRKDEWRVCRIDTVSEVIPALFTREEGVAIVAAYFFDNREFFLNSFWQAKETEKFEYLWFDPVSGQYFDAFANVNGGYRIPGCNSGGNRDWIFLVRSEL